MSTQSQDARLQVQFKITNKRKGDDVFANDGPSRVVVGNSLKDQLQVLRRANNEEEDPILSAMKAIDQNDGDAENSMMKESEQIKSKLQREIQQAKDACQHESGVLSDLANKLDTMRQKRTSLSNNVEALNQRQIEVQRKIALHQEETSQEIDSIDQVEEEQKRQVPRLKTQISLYASTTGIKWDFAQDDILSGSVVSTALFFRSIPEMLHGGVTDQLHSFTGGTRSAGFASVLDRSTRSVFGWDGKSFVDNDGGACLNMK